MNVTPERRALSAHAIQLRCERKSVQEIADILGVSRSYASDLYCDPDKTKQARRRNGYRKPCPSCGALMDGSQGNQGPRTCANCAGEARRVWTKEAIIESFQEFHAKMGRAPAALDTHIALLRHANVSDRRRQEALSHGVELPQPETVRQRFGSWPKAIKAAGLPPSLSGGAGHRELGRVQTQMLDALEVHGSMRYIEIERAVGQRGISSILISLTAMGLIEREQVGGAVYYHYIPE